MIRSWMIYPFQRSILKFFPEKFGMPKSGQVYKDLSIGASIS